MQYFLTIIDRMIKNPRCRGFLVLYCYYSKAKNQLTLHSQPHFSKEGLFLPFNMIYYDLMLHTDGMIITHFVILIGCSGVMEKMSLGHRAQSGPVGTFGKCTEERWGNRTPGKAHRQVVSPPGKNPLLCFGCYCPGRRRLLWRYRLISV